MSIERELSLALLLRRADRRVAVRLSTVLASHGGALEQWHVLSCLADGSGWAMSEIGAAVAVPAPSMSKLIDAMVADNLVHRRIDPGDRRRVLVHLTPRGRRLHDVLSAAVEQDELELQRLQSDDEVAGLRACLLSLLARLDTSGVPARRRPAPGKQPAATGRPPLAASVSTSEDVRDAGGKAASHEHLTA